MPCDHVDDAMKVRMMRIDDTTDDDDDDDIFVNCSFFSDFSESPCSCCKTE